MSPDAPRPRVRDYQREASTGTSLSYLLRRLSKVAPEAYERVKRGEITAHRAAVEAGCVEHTLKIPRDNPARAARTVLRHMAPETARALATNILEALDAATSGRRAAIHGGLTRTGGKPMVQ